MDALRLYKVGRTMSIPGSETDVIGASWCCVSDGLVEKATGVAGGPVGGAGLRRRDRVAGWGTRPRTYRQEGIVTSDST